MSAEKSRVEAIPEMLRLSDVAKTLHVQTKTLVRWSEERKFPRLYYYGGRHHVAAADLETWLEHRPGDPDQDELRADHRDMMAGFTKRRRKANSVLRGLYAP